jgi:hypothetical protein
MRHHFYGDRNDVWKWSVVLNATESSKTPRSVVYVAMITQEQGHVFDPVPNARPDVEEFFAAERAEFDKGPVRHVGRVRGLFEKLGMSIDIIDARYTHPGRVRYFQTVTDLLQRRPTARRDVVLLDPDTGIEPGKPDDTHVCLEQLRAVLDVLRPEDTLIVYQHQYHGTNWVEDAVRKLAKCLAVEPSIVRAVGDSRVRFLIAERGNPSDRKASAVVNNSPFGTNVPA